ncbi:outer membrane protein assembly factor BamD [bacterium]|nr:outer membrane protein assembly factor BamD [bacterium]
MINKRTIFIILLIFISYSTLSCSRGIKGIKLTEEELWNISDKQIKQDFSKSFRGWFREEKFLRTVKVLERLLEDYPESKYTPRAQIRIADLYYIKGSKNLVDAEAEYDSFLKRYPMGEEAQRAHYRYGMSLFRQFLDEKPKIKSLEEFDKIIRELSKYDRFMDKDLTLIKKASQAFADLVIFYPTSPYRDYSLKYLEIISYLFSLRDLYVAEYYFNQKDYRAAYKRLDPILYDCPNTIDVNKVKYLIGVCLWNLKFKKESLDILKDLQKITLDSKLKKKISKSLEKFNN